MRRVRCWNDIEPFGIVPLTGEACGMGYRILFDVTERGRAIVGSCLGVPDIRLADPWNRGGSDDEHVGSVMLTQEMFAAIAVFALLGNGCTEVWQLTDGSVLGIEADDPADHVAAAAKAHATDRGRTYAFRGTAGDRNVHQMSGRVV